MSSSNSPCAACKFLRRKCTPGCVFAPYFPPDQPQKFANVHRVFGASNVAKLLNELSPAQREDAVNSLAYEAEARLRDPVYGCVGYISILQHKLKQVQHDLYNAKMELSTYIGPAALGPFLPHPGPHQHAALVGGPHHHPQYQFQGASSSSRPPFGVPGMGIGMTLGLAAGAGTSASPHNAQILMQEQQQQQQMVEAQQLAAAAAAVREQEMLRSYEQQQQQQQLELAIFGTGYTDGGRGFDQMGGGATVAVAPEPSSRLALVSPQPIETPFLSQHLQQEQQYAQQPWQQQQQARYQHQRTGSDEGSSGMGPSFSMERREQRHEGSSGLGPSS